MKGKREVTVAIVRVFLDFNRFSRIQTTYINIPCTHTNTWHTYIFIYLFFIFIFVFIIYIYIFIFIFMFMFIFIFIFISIFIFTYKVFKYPVVCYTKYSIRTPHLVDFLACHVS